MMVFYHMAITCLQLEINTDKGWSSCLESLQTQMRTCRTTCTHTHRWSQSKLHIVSGDITSSMDIRHLDSQDIIQVFTHIPSVNEGHVYVQSLQKV